MLAKYTLKTGAQPPLVFLHGFLGTAADWNAVVSQLPFHCIAFDLPGHGRSPFTPDFCKAFLRSTEDLKPFHLIGYSMGGRLSLQFAADHPDNILSLTLLSTHLGLTTAQQRARRLAKDRDIAQEILKISIDEFLKRWYDQKLFESLGSKMDICAMRKNQNCEGLSQAIEAFSLGRQLDFSPQLPRHTHLFVGEFDETYRVHYRGLPHEVIENAGHAIHLEHPQAVANALQRNLL